MAWDALDGCLSMATIRGALDGYEYEEVELSPRLRQAAVAAVLREGDDGAEALLIHRAEHPLDPWSGHMSFTGGRVDESDPSPLAAAVREAREEVDLDLERQATLLGRLSDLPALARGRPISLVIVPYVFELIGEPQLQPNYEVQEIVWVPLSFLADEDNRESMEWQREGEPRPRILPCYHYQNHLIWGLTLFMVDELLARCREFHHGAA